jgi:hypothetical protein
LICKLLRLKTLRLGEIEILKQRFRNSSANQATAGEQPKQERRRNGGGQFLAEEAHEGETAEARTPQRREI